MSVNRRPSTPNSWERVNGDHPQNEQHRISSGTVELVWNSALLLLPMLAFSGVLLALVYVYRVEFHPPGLVDFHQGQTLYADDAIYVDFSAPRLVFIASWSSTLAAILVGSLMFLVSYPTAKSMLLSQEAQRGAALPTPFQISLVLRMLVAGGVMAIWDWLHYLVGWRKKRQAQSHMIKAVASVLVTATFLSLLVFLADTWLHVTTNSTQFTQISHLGDPPDYSFGLRESCISGPSYDCYLNPAATNIFLVHSEVSFAVLGNISSAMTVNTLHASPPYTYLGVPDSPRLSSTDYRAYTYALRTECTPITRKCNLFALDGAENPYYRTNGFQGVLMSTEPWQLTYVADATYKQNITFSQNNTNPFYFGWAALVDSAGLTPLGVTEDPDIIHPIHGGTAFVLACNTTVYDVSYDSVNGSITRFVVQPSNTTLANVAQQSISLTQVADPHLQQYAVTASSSNTAQELADKMALSYSKAALSIAAQSFKAAPAIAGAVLLVIALVARTAEVREAQVRLGITGLVAHAFESKGRGKPVREVEELFEENEGLSSARVGLQRVGGSCGGVVYRLLGDEEMVRFSGG